MEFLAKEFELGPGMVVLDIGAGTGKLTRGLHLRGARAVAVEPLAAMRKVFRSTIRGVKVVDGMAEHLPFPDKSVDLITAGQSFHWFDQRKALREFARVLRPGGGVALLWNFQDYRAVWVLRVWKDFGLHSPRIPGYHRPPLSTTFRRNGHFSRIHRRIFHEPVEVQKPGQVLERIGSLSWFSALPPKEREVILNRAKELLQAHARRGGRRWLELPHDTEVVWCRLRTPSRLQG